MPKILKFSYFSPFTFETADRLAGECVTVICLDPFNFSQHTHTGVVERITTGRTKIGDDVILNDEVISLILK